MAIKGFKSDFVNNVDEIQRGIADETGAENVKVENTVTLNKQNLFVLKSGKGSSAQNLLVSTSIEQVLVAKELNLKEYPFANIQVFHGCGSDYDTLIGYLRTGNSSSNDDVLDPEEVYLLMDELNNNIYMTSSLRNLLVTKFYMENKAGGKFHFDIFVEGQRWGKSFQEYIEFKNNGKQE